MVSNLTEALPCPKFTLFKTKAYLPIIKIIILNRFATDDHGALMSYLEGTPPLFRNSNSNSNSFKIAQKTAFEVKGRLYTTDKVIQRLFIIDLYA